MFRSIRAVRKTDIQCGDCFLAFPFPDLESLWIGCQAAADGIPKPVGSEGNASCFTVRLFLAAPIPKTLDLQRVESQVAGSAVGIPGPVGSKRVLNFASTIAP